MTKIFVYPGNYQFNSSLTQPVLIASPFSIRRVPIWLNCITNQQIFFFSFSNNSKKPQTIIVFQPILGRDLESSQKISFSLLALVRFSCQQRHFPILRSLLNMIFALLLYNAECADGASRSKIKIKLHCIFKWIPSSGNHGS